MALPAAVLLSGMQSPQLKEIADQIDIIPPKLLQGLEDLKKESNSNFFLSNPYLKMVSSMDSGIGTSDSDYSRTPSPNRDITITEFEFKTTKIDERTTIEEKNFNENRLETVPEEENGNETAEIVEPKSVPIYDNVSEEASSEYSSSDTAGDSVDWLTTIGNSVEKLKYYMNVIDRLENKFTLFAQSNCPEGHIFSTLDPKIMHEKRDILDLASNMRGNNWNFRGADVEMEKNESVISRLDGAELPPYHIKKCKIADCSYNEPIYD